MPSRAALSDPGPGPAPPERAVWLATIYRALRDATGTVCGGEQTMERERARSWLVSGGQDFAEVCHLANLDPAYVRRRVRPIQERGWTRMPAERVRATLHIQRRIE